MWEFLRSNRNRRGRRIRTCGGAPRAMWNDVGRIILQVHDGSTTMSVHDVDTVRFYNNCAKSACILPQRNKVDGGRQSNVSLHNPLAHGWFDKASLLRRDYPGMKKGFYLRQGNNNNP